MADAPSHEPKDQTGEKPTPEVLKPRTDDASDSPDAPRDTHITRQFAPRRHQSYQLSHRATFIGLAVVVAILALNAGVLVFVLKGQSRSKTQADQGVVTVSQAALDKLGVNQSDAGKLGVQLVVNPNAKFNGDLTVGGDTSISGQLKLNSKFSANDASLTQLEAGKTSLESLDVNGDGTLTNLNIRKDLVVVGVARLQGPTVMSQLLTVNNNANIAGSLAVGGTLTVSNFHTSSLIIDSTLTIGGHVITSGRLPFASAGPSVGQNGTVSVSGNDAAGTVAVNIGAGGGSGTLVNITFRSPYTNTPHVVVTPVGTSPGNYYVNRSAAGFSIAVAGSVPLGSYAFDYIVEQ